MAVRKRFDALQTLRFLLFLVVFGEHSGFYRLIGVPIFFEISIMSVFLMMSGFLMFYTYSERELSTNPVENVKFSIGRIKKLYPLHVETALIQLAFVIFFFFDYFKTNPEGFGYFSFRVGVNLALLQAWVPNLEEYTFFLNGPSWFLSVMLFAYFLFPYIVKLLKKLKTIRNGVIAAVLLFTISFIVTILVGSKTGYLDSEFFIWFTMNSPIMRTTDFILGCIIGFIYVERRKTADIDAKPYSKGLWTFYEIMSFLLLQVFSVFIVAGVYLIAGDIGIALAYCTVGLPCLIGLPILLVCIYGRGYMSKLFSWKPLVYLGDISMYTYLIHYIYTQLWAYLQDYVFGIDKSDPRNIYMVPVEFVLTIGTAILYDKFRKKRAAAAKAKVVRTIEGQVEGA